MRWYVVYLADTDEVVANGTALECAEQLKRSLNGFYCLISQTRSGRIKKYVVVTLEDEETK